MSLTFRKLDPSSELLSGAIHTFRFFLATSMSLSLLDTSFLQITAAGRPDATPARDLRFIKAPAVDGIFPEFLGDFKGAYVLFVSIRPDSEEGHSGRFARRQREAVSLRRRHIRSDFSLRILEGKAMV